MISARLPGSGKYEWFNNRLKMNNTQSVKRNVKKRNVKNAARKPAVASRKGAAESELAELHLAPAKVVRAWFRYSRDRQSLVVAVVPEGSDEAITDAFYFHTPDAKRVNVDILESCFEQDIMQIVTNPDGLIGREVRISVEEVLLDNGKRVKNLRLYPATAGISMERAATLFSDMLPETATPENVADARELDF